MTWSHRDRVLAALNHEETDRVPIDFGGTNFTTITLPAYEHLKQFLGLEHETKVSRISSCWRPRIDRCSSGSTSTPAPSVSDRHR